MNFPMMQPIFQFFYWLVNTPGLGGIGLALIIGGVVIAAIATFLWINEGGKGKDLETYSYPTPPLYHANEDDD